MEKLFFGNGPERSTDVKLRLIHARHEDSAAAITGRKGDRLIVAVDIIDRAAVFREIGRAEHIHRGDRFTERRALGENVAARTPGDQEIA